MRFYLILYKLCESSNLQYGYILMGTYGTSHDSHDNGRRREGACYRYNSESPLGGIWPSMFQQDPAKATRSMHTESDDA